MYIALSWLFLTLFQRGFKECEVRVSGSKGDFTIASKMASGLPLNRAKALWNPVKLISISTFLFYGTSFYYQDSNWTQCSQSFVSSLYLYPVKNLIQKSQWFEFALSEQDWRSSDENDKRDDWEIIFDILLLAPYLPLLHIHLYNTHTPLSWYLVGALVWLLLFSINRVHFILKSYFSLIHNSNKKYPSAEIVICSIPI